MPTAPTLLRRFAILLLLGVCAPGLSAQQDAFSLDGLVVTTSPLPRASEAVAGHVTVLEGESLRAGGLRTVADALRHTAGIDVVRGGSFGAVTSLFMRGGESDYVLVLIDGVQVNQPGGSYDFAGLSLANVERIEVVRGPSSALYGSDAVAGVVHVITSTSRSGLRGELSSEVGTFGRRDWSAGVRGGSARSSYAFALDRQATDGILAFNNRSTGTAISASGRFVPDDRTRADVTLRVGDRTYHFPTDGSGSVVDRNAFTYGDDATVGASLRRTVSELLSLEVRVGVSDWNGGQDDRADGPADTLGFFGFTSLDHVRRSTLDIRTHLELGDAIVTAGWEWEEERQRSFTESASQFGTSFGRSENERMNRGYYAHVAGGGARFSYSLGARLEDNERFGDHLTWQGGLSALLSASAGTRLRASVGSALKEPTFFETFATGFALGNPELDPERSESWEVGVDQPVGRAVTLRATYFSQDFRDLIQYTFSPPRAGAPNYFNVAAASARGLEISARGGWESVEYSASWSWLDSEVVDSGFETGPGATFVRGEALLRRPATRGQVRAGWRPSDVLALHVDAVYVGERSDRDFSAFPAVPISLDAYTRVGLGGRWTVRPVSDGGFGFALDLRTENLLDRSYQETFGFLAPGRGLYVGGRLLLG